MGLTAKSTGGGKDFPILAAGSYAARCYSMVEIGQTTEEFKGETKTQQKVFISWEFPTELAIFDEEKGEQPYVLSKEFTLSLADKSNLKKFLESWRGQNFTKEELAGFDISKLLGAKCLMSVKHKEPNAEGKVWPEISGVALLPKGMECPELINPKRLLTYDEWNEEIFQSLPKFVKDKMETTPEYKELRSGKTTPAPAATSEGGDDTLPF